MHNDTERDPIDPLEVFGMIELSILSRYHKLWILLTASIELIRTIKDPEHPISLEQLYVIQVCLEICVLSL